MNRRAPPVGGRRLTTLKAFVFGRSIGVLLDGVLELPMEASAGEERYELGNTANCSEPSTSVISQQ